MMLYNYCLFFIMLYKLLQRDSFFTYDKILFFQKYKSPNIILYCKQRRLVMEKKQIYVKIQIEKDVDTDQLILKTKFDPDAPNFYQDNYGIGWIPTPEELEFINDAFRMVPRYKK